MRKGSGRDTRHGGKTAAADAVLDSVWRKSFSGGGGSVSSLSEGPLMSDSPPNSESSTLPSNLAVELQCFSAPALRAPVSLQMAAAIECKINNNLGVLEA